MNARHILQNQSKRKRSDYSVNFASVADAIEAIRKQLTPDLLKNEYTTQSTHPMFGHCYVATEALWHLTGQRFHIYRGKDDHGITHWWLQDALGNRYDATYDQYTDRGENPPYERGVRAGFLTGDKPSKRTKELLSRIVI